MNKTIGILAHVDAGKTTFAEEILYYTNSIKTRGRVDHKDSFLDSNDVEKDRGITIFSKQAIFNYNGSNYYLIDTPGHIDFSPEMERTIEIMDYAIIIISAVEGVQGHTETVWHLLRKYNIPTFFFINKIDRVGSNAINVLKEIKESLTKDVCFINESFDESKMAEKVYEFIAERDEALLDNFLEERFEKVLWIQGMKRLIKENKMFPCFAGSALQNIGIENFLRSLDLLTYTDYNEKENFKGRVFKIIHDEGGNRVSFIKALSGTLKVRDEIGSEKISRIREYNGYKYRNVEKVYAGEIFGVLGLQNVSAGDGVGELIEKSSYEMVPMLKSKVLFSKDINVKEVLRYFKILESEEPSLKVFWNESLQEIQVHIMGIIQLEVLKKLVQERYSISVDFGPCEILYKETISKDTIGYGHFEPLRHYAEVHLSLEVGERNSGIIFESKCHTDDLTIGNQNLVGTHIYEREHHGVLTGSTITDIKITLLTGRAHNKHTCGGDFREATFRALRQGLEKANCVLLEPFYRFKMEAEIDYMGKILSDIQRLKGTFDPPKSYDNKILISGRGPVSTFMNYSIDFIPLTKGKGKISFIYDGYDFCHNGEEIIEKRNYNKDADIEYTSNSVFCSKGQGYIVKGEEAESYMHCL